MSRDITIGVDFDGTVVMHKYPYIGKPVPYALDSLRLLHKRGCKIILWTCRDGEELKEAVNYLTSEGIELYGVNSNPDTDHYLSNKIYSTYYIDDKALGCPLIYPAGHGRPYVDWRLVMDLLAIRLGPDI